MKDLTKRLLPTDARLLLRRAYYRGRGMPATSSTAMPE
jgi:hypothetical protein